MPSFDLLVMIPLVFVAWSVLAIICWDVLTKEDD